MSERKKTKDNFIAQAGILMAAGMISRIIGLLYKSPLTGVIGEAGMGYYQEAYSFYFNVLTISSYSIPSAVSKIIAQKLAAREYRNAHRLFYCVMGYVLVVGFAASLLLFFGAHFFVAEEAVPVLQSFAPTIFIFGMLGVLRGYFQAHRSMVQTSVSQILEQIVNAVVSVGGAMLILKSVFGSVSLPPLEEGQVKASVYGVIGSLTGSAAAVRNALSVKHAVYGAIGSALGTGSGVLTALLFMTGMYFLNRKMILRRVAHDKHTETESYGKMIGMITMVVLPFILSTAVYNLNDSINAFLYNKQMVLMKGLDSAAQHRIWGIYSGQSLTVQKIPLAFATAMAAAMIPSISAAMAGGHREEAAEKIGLATKTTMLIAIPSAVGLFALAKPVMFFLFPRPDAVVTQAGKYLMILSVSVVFYSLSTLSNSILQGLGKMKAPIINAAIALGVQSVATFFLLLYTDLDCYAMAMMNTGYAGLMCLLNQISLRRAIDYRQEWKRSFLRPAAAAILMGMVARRLYELIYIFTESMRISLIPAIVVGVISYFVFLLLFRAVNEEEMKAFPKGYLFVKIAKKLKLL
ncbi:MAG: polysaccharide biosynthesis protein [Lachnospiraceae bacterium]|nr:polysaccharide biosynthesis protein [Lachnospiraceae bacterium]